MQVDYTAVKESFVGRYLSALLFVKRDSLADVDLTSMDIGFTLDSKDVSPFEVLSVLEQGLHSEKAPEAETSDIPPEVRRAMAQDTDSSEVASFAVESRETVFLQDVIEKLRQASSAAKSVQEETHSSFSSAMDSAYSNACDHSNENVQEAMYDYQPSEECNANVIEYIETQIGALNQLLPEACRR